MRQGTHCRPGCSDSMPIAAVVNYVPECPINLRNSEGLLPHCWPGCSDSMPIAEVENNVPEWCWAVTRMHLNAVEKWLMHLNGISRCDLNDSTVSSKVTVMPLKVILSEIQCLRCLPIVWWSVDWCQPILTINTIRCNANSAAVEQGQSVMHLIEILREDRVKQWQVCRLMSTDLYNQIH